MVSRLEEHVHLRDKARRDLQPKRTLEVTSALCRRSAAVESVPHALAIEVDCADAAGLEDAGRDPQRAHIVQLLVSSLVAGDGAEWGPICSGMTWRWKEEREWRTVLQL
jgi:hypothetical protein